MTIITVVLPFPGFVMTTIIVKCATRATARRISLIIRVREGFVGRATANPAVIIA